METKAEAKDSAAAGKEGSNRKKIIGRVILIGLFAAGGIIGLVKYREAQRYESTDDASLETDITPVSARIAGYVTSVRFTDNQQVHKGDTLVTLDDKDLKLKVQMAEAALDNAKASLVVAKSNVQSVHAGEKTGDIKIEELRIRLAHADTEYIRYQNLMHSGATTQQQLDRARLDKESLEKQVEAAQQQTTETESRTNVASEQTGVAESVIKQREADLDFAKLQLSYAVIVAPYDGVVSKRNAVTGQLMQAGQPVCSLIASNKIWVIANFKETQIAAIHPGMKVLLSIDAFPDKEITGKVASFAAATGSRFSLIPPDNATGNYVKVVQRIPVKIEIDADAQTLAILKPGMSAEVRVVVKE